MGAESIIITVILFLIALIVCKYIVGERGLNLPPGPFPLPIVGNLPLLGRDPLVSLLRLRAQYGDVFTLYLGSRRVIVLCGLGTIKEALVRHAQAFAGRPHDVFMMEVNKGKGLGLTQGPVWREQQRFCHKVFRNLTVGQPVFEGNILAELSHFLSRLDETQKCGMPINILDHIQTAVSNIICSVVFGNRFEYTDPKFVDYISILEENTKLMGTSGILSIFPILRYLPGDIFKYKRVLRNMSAVHDFVRQQMTEHRTRPNKPNTPTNLMDAFLDEMANHTEDEDTSFTEEQGVCLITELFAAGTETTANTLNWGILYMIRHPDIQERVQQEILNVIGPLRMPSMADKPSMPFTEACLMEIQRMADISPMALPHATMDHVTLHGYVIPQGTMVLPLLTSVHRDPAVWPEPYTFCPDRFLNTQNEIQHKDQIIPFSLGKRVCLGESLARMELFLFLTAMLQRFSFCCPPGHPLPSTDSILGVTRSPLPYTVMAIKKTLY